MTPCRCAAVPLARGTILPLQRGRAAGGGRGCSYAQPTLPSEVFQVFSGYNQFPDLATLAYYLDREIIELQ